MALYADKKKISRSNNKSVQDEDMSFSILPLGKSIHFNSEKADAFSEVTSC